jgi:hypothetical protein
MPVQSWREASLPQGSVSAEKKSNEQDYLSNNVENRPIEAGSHLTSAWGNATATAAKAAVLHARRRPPSSCEYNIFRRNRALFARTRRFLVRSLFAMFVPIYSYSRALFHSSGNAASFAGCSRSTVLNRDASTSRVASRPLTQGPGQLVMRQRRDLREEKRLRNLEYARLHRKRVPRSAAAKRFGRTGNNAQSAAERESVYSLYFTLTHAKQGGRSGRRDKQQDRESGDES